METKLITKIIMWLVVQSVFIDVLPDGKKQFYYMFKNSHDTYQIAYNSDSELEFKENGWYKLKIKAECEKIITYELYNTGKSIIFIDKIVHFCNAMEVNHEKPNVSNCFFVNGVCYY